MDLDWVVLYRSKMDWVWTTLKLEKLNIRELWTIPFSFPNLDPRPCESHMIMIQSFNTRISQCRISGFLILVKRLVWFLICFIKLRLPSTYVPIPDIDLASVASTSLSSAFSIGGMKLEKVRFKFKHTFLYIVDNICFSNILKRTSCIF